MVATDLDTRFLQAVESPNLEVRTHNIVTDDLETGSYDLVHARYVLLHINEWQTALKKMVDSLKPGGWLILEDPDVNMESDALAEEADRLTIDKNFEAFRKMTLEIGWDMKFGSNTLKAFRDYGLEYLNSEGRSLAVFSGTPSAEFIELTWEQLKGGLISTGVVSGEEVDNFIELTKSPNFAIRSMLTVFTWGRKPD